MRKEIADAFNCIIEFLAVRDLTQKTNTRLKVHPFSWIKPQPIHPRILKMPYKYLRHVDVPEEVNCSFERIADEMPEYLVRCQ